MNKRIFNNDILHYANYYCEHLADWDYDSDSDSDGDD